MILPQHGKARQDRSPLRQVAQDLITFCSLTLSAGGSNKDGIGESYYQSLTEVEAPSLFNIEY